MRLEEIIESIYALGEEIKRFEKKYGLTSEDFYELFREGKLDEGSYEETEEFTQWAGLYEIKLKRERQFREQSRRLLANLQQRGDEIIHLVPRASTVEA